MHKACADRSSTSHVGLRIVRSLSFPRETTDSASPLPFRLHATPAPERQQPRSALIQALAPTATASFLCQRLVHLPFAIRGPFSRRMDHRSSMERTACRREWETTAHDDTRTHAPWPTTQTTMYAHIPPALRRNAHVHSRPTATRTTTATAERGDVTVRCLPIPTTF